jgi:hypothetical protein
MQEAIAGFELTRFGSALDSYYDASEAESDAQWHYKRKD